MAASNAKNRKGGGGSGGGSGGANNIVSAKGLRKPPKNNIVPFDTPKRAMDRIAKKLPLVDLNLRMTQLRSLGNQASAEISKRRRNRQALDRPRAQAIAMTKRAYERNNPSKLIRVPKGTSQREYYDIVSRVSSGDKQAIQQFTVKRPKGYKTADQRRAQQERKRK